MPDIYSTQLFHKSSGKLHSKRYRPLKTDTVIKYVRVSSEDEVRTCGGTELPWSNFVQEQAEAEDCGNVVNCRLVADKSVPVSVYVGLPQTGHGEQWYCETLNRAHTRIGIIHTLIWEVTSHSGRLHTTSRYNVTRTVPTASSYRIITRQSHNKLSHTAKNNYRRRIIISWPVQYCSGWYERACFTKTVQAISVQRSFYVPICTQTILLQNNQGQYLLGILWAQMVQNILTQASGL